jgi:hypothetical protein
MEMMGTRSLQAMNAKAVVLSLIDNCGLRLANDINTTTNPVTGQMPQNIQVGRSNAGDTQSLGFDMSLDSVWAGCNSLHDNQPFARGPLDSQTAIENLDFLSWDESFGEGRATFSSWGLDDVNYDPLLPQR